VARHGNKARVSVKTPLELKEQFGAVVRSRRMGLQISQEELAGRAGLHRTYIADIERGARNPSLESIDRLARALEVSIAGLFAAPATNTEAVDILLVEDDANDVVLTLRAFEKAHLSNRVHVAKDGAEALAYIFCTGPYARRRLEQRPKVILLDLGLPKVDGLEVLRRIKHDERTRLIPVVVLTMSQQARDIAECRRLGADSYIVKPVDFQRLSQITPQLNLSWMLLKPCVSGAA